MVNVNRALPSSAARHGGGHRLPESIDGRGEVESADRQFAPVPVPGLISPIRRKVGFELELKLDLRKGRVTTESEAPKKKKKPKEQFVGWRSDDKQLGESSWLLTKEPIEVVTSGPTERMEPAEDQDIKKGETILPGAGWRLTPDGAQGDWYPEFITDAIDEDKQPTRPAEIMGSVTDYVGKNWTAIVPGKYLQLPNGFVVGKPERASRKADLGANIHFTVGVRPDRILQLMTLLGKARTGPVSEKDIVDTGLDFEEDIQPLQTDDISLLSIDESTRTILETAAKAGGKAGGDAIYRGVVALMGSYIAGELRILMSAGDVVGRLSKRLRYCIDGKNLQEFLLTGEITDTESLGFIKEKYSDWKQFSSDLTESLEGTGPGAAKLQVPVLSRSSLAKLRSKTTIGSYPAFLTDVMTAAGLTTNQSQFPLFPLGISNPKRQRTVEAEPDISIEEWVKSVFDGENLTFTDEVKSFEKVGPSVPGCLCWCETRAKGAVLEIRALDANRRVPPQFWPDLANEVVAMMRELNGD